MSDDRPNVLFLLSDQHSYRHVSHRYAGDAPVDTPTIDGLAETGTVFERAYCPVPLCTPSRMCLLTGREAQRCGAWENWHMLEPGLPTLPGTLSDAGYETCLVGKMHLGGDRQFCGFDHRPYGDLTGRTGHQSDPPHSYWEKEEKNIVYGRGVTGIPESLLQEQNVVQESLSFVREHEAANPDAPWFLCASFSRPHGPMTAPRRHCDRHSPRDTRLPEVRSDGDVDHPAVKPDVTDEMDLLEQRAAYFACVDFLDETIGDLVTLLDRGGFLDDTIVIYVSDHGEMAGEHGMFGKMRWYEHATRVPCIVELPSHRAGDDSSPSVTTPTSLVDLFPTICGLCDVELPAGLDGHDLSTAARTGVDPDRPPVVCDYLTPTFGVPEYRMVCDGRHKYVQFREHPDLLFDLESDPLERTNVASDADGADAEALSRLRRYVDETLDFAVVDAVRRRDEEELVEHTLAVSGATDFVNAYHLPDGRIVEAETPLYRPHVIAEKPSRVYPDWPGDAT